MIMYLLNRILLIIATTSTILIGLFILYCLLRFFLLIVIPEEIDHFRSWKKKRNKNIAHKNVHHGSASVSL